MKDFKTNEEIANMFQVSPSYVHNSAKRFFNKVVAQMLKTYPDMTMLEVVTECMNMWDYDESIIKLLNRKHKAMLALELADKYKVVARGNAKQEQIDIFRAQAEEAE